MNTLKTYCYQDRKSEVYKYFDQISMKSIV